MANKKKSATTTIPGTTETKKKETKAEKFVRLAQSRVSKAVRVIYNIGNLGGTGYESTQEQRDKIITALNQAIESVSNRLNKETVKPTGFTL